jgi:hypothetical protein
MNTKWVHALVRVMTKTALRTTQELLDDQPGLDPKTIFVSVAMVVIEEWIDHKLPSEDPKAEV